MIAAIYARKSSERAVANEAKSVRRQIDHARQCATRKGWSVSEAHVFVDDGVVRSVPVARSGTMVTWRAAAMSVASAWRWLRPQTPTRAARSRTAAGTSALTSRSAKTSTARSLASPSGDAFTSALGSK